MAEVAGAADVDEEQAEEEVVVVVDVAVAGVARDEVLEVDAHDGPQRGVPSTEDDIQDEFVVQEGHGNVCRQLRKTSYLHCEKS